MFSVLQQRNYALLWFGQLISTIGDWVLALALPFYIYSLTNSILATGGMFIATTISPLLLGSVAGVFADRWNRRIIMIASDISRGILLLTLFFVHSTTWIWLIYVVAIIEAMISQFFRPAKSALIPTLVDREELVAANSLDAFSDAITRLLGPSLGGMIYGLLGIVSIITIDSLSYGISALLIALIITSHTVPFYVNFCN